jgi:hypothetical protein
MDWLKGMELIHKPAQDAWALGPGSVLEVFVFPSGEHQQSKDELSVVQELDAEGPRSHELPRWILSAYPYLACLYRHIIVRSFF